MQGVILYAQLEILWVQRLPTSEFSQKVSIIFGQQEHKELTKMLVLEVELSTRMTTRNAGMEECRNGYGMADILTCRGRKFPLRPDPCVHVGSKSMVP